MKIKTFSKAIFSLALVALCGIALVTLTAEPSDALGLNSCPAPCQPSFGGVYIGNCHIIDPGCHKVCMIYQDSSGTKCYKECYTI